MCRERVRTCVLDVANVLGDHIDAGPLKIVVAEEAKALGEETLNRLRLGEPRRDTVLRHVERGDLAESEIKHACRLEGICLVGTGSAQ